jgi:hypothetical protein
LNVTYKAPYKRYEGKTNDLLISFIGYVNNLNKLQQFNVSVKKIPPSTSMHFSTLLTIVRVTLLRSSWRCCFRRAAELKSALKSMVGFLDTYFELLQFIEIIYIANKCNK